MCQMSYMGFALQFESQNITETGRWNQCNLSCFLSERMGLARVPVLDEAGAAVQSKAHGPRSPSELSMAKALAEATQAAASAATAAASAASACIRPYDGSRQVMAGSGGGRAASGAWTPCQ